MLMARNFIAELHKKNRYLSEHIENSYVISTFLCTYVVKNDFLRKPVMHLLYLKNIHQQFF
jgi:hypothetical protein